MRKLSLLLMVCMLFIPVMAKEYPADVYKTSNGNKVTVTPIKHGTLMLTLGNIVVMVDPVGEYADYNQFPKADILLITHEHGDHFDAQAMKQSSKPAAIIVSNPSVYEKIQKGVVLKNGEDALLMESVLIEAVPAYNITEGRDRFHPRGNGNGYIVNYDGMRIYIAGDTEDIPEMKELENIDIAFLPVNQPYTMTPEQAIRATKWFNPKVMYPYHISNTDLTPIARELKGSKTEVKIRVF